MQMTGQVRLHLNRQRVWDALNDPAVLAVCIDGCEALERVSADEFAATVIIKVGPVKARFAGKISLCDVVAPHRYRLIGEASSGAAGYATAQIEVNLEALEPELTLLDYRVESKVGGKLAQLGSRLIETTAQQYANRFFIAFEQQIKAAPVDGGLARATTTFHINAETFSANPEASPVRDAAGPRSAAQQASGHEGFVSPSNADSLHWPQSAAQAAHAMGALQEEVQSVLDSEQIKVWIEDHIAVVTLNRPASRNAMTLSMWRTIPAILATLEGDANVRAVILTGAGTDFCAGADIPEFDRVRSDPEQSLAYEIAVDACCDAIAQINKPMIAVLRGYCLGGGAHLAMSCDFRYAASDAVFGIPAARLSIIYGVKGTLKLLTLVGLPRAKKILFSAERFDAQEALTIGFVEHVAQTRRAESDGWLSRLLGRSPQELVGDPMADARVFAKSLILNAPLTQKGAKTILNGLAFGRGSLDLQHAERLIAQAAASEDYREGRKAFAARRAPDFQGR
ncbi:MAG: hypothetical protein EBT08_15810 [Betaproteobacteria bacterium]|nr:hypothetical protein [Betaproteobacteria bacterium]